MKVAVTHYCEEIAGKIDVLEQVFNLMGKRTKADKRDAVTGKGSMVPDARAFKMPDTAGLVAAVLAQENKADKTRTKLDETGGTAAAAEIQLR
jgi:hypothetical protein